MARLDTRDQLKNSRQPLFHFLNQKLDLFRQLNKNSSGLFQISGRRMRRFGAWARVDDLFRLWIMANFDFRQIPEDLLHRYDTDMLGYEAWQRLLVNLREFLGAEQADQFLNVFDEFLRDLEEIEAKPAVYRVFVSHQRRDMKYAERIAYLVNRIGFEYWLDVHDPLLNLAKQTTLSPIVQSILIAAIIEMALLNCTHGISVQTNNSQSSAWVPYEFGRAKQRWLISTQVASWFDNQVYVNSTADYLKLGVCAQSEKEVKNWLKVEFRRCRCHPTQDAWRGYDEPARLPN